MNMSSRAMLFSVAGTCIIAVAAAGAYFYYHDAFPAQGSPLPAFADLDTARHASSTPREAPPGSKLYQSSRYGFSVLYPDGLAIRQYDEGGGASTLTFQDPQDAQGFQVFIVPYAEPQVSAARFKEDEPSGVREGVKTVHIDGATGASFYSTNLTLGDTAEIWFIHGGYLYEVTTLKPLASWLSEIMASWQFE